jgi:peroxiredoxin Q/BCP
MSRTSASRLKVRAGDQIPSIGLRASDGYLLNLRSFVTKQPVAFLFFGAATMQGAARRTGHKVSEALAEGYERLREAGIAVVGVSCDSAEQQTEYIAEHKLPYLLFSDERRSAVDILGIPTVNAGDNYNVAAPVVLAVDMDGVIRAVLEKPIPEIVVESIMRAFAEPLPTPVEPPIPEP